MKSVITATLASVFLSLMLTLPAHAADPIAPAAKPAAKAASGKEFKYTRKPSVYDKLPAAKKGGIHYTSLSGNPKVMNPILSTDNNSRLIEGFLWATLMTDDPETLEPLPYLAESFSVSADKKEYTFVLNPNAKWQDGTPVTTDDVKFTFDTLMNPKTDAAPLRSYWLGATLQVKDARTFTYRIEEPKFDTLRFFYGAQIIQKKQFEKERDFNKARGILEPVGNGPYVFKSFSRDQKIELDRNPNWWGSALPHFKNRFNADKVVFRLINDQNLLYERFLKSEIDLIRWEGVNIEIYATKVKGTDKARFATSPTGGKDFWHTEIKNKAPRGYIYVGWNLKRPIFQSKKTRQALAHLADIQTIIDKVLYGYAIQTTSPFGSLSLNSDQSLRKPGKMFTYDVKKALALLKEDGWVDSDKDNLLDKTINGQKTPFRFELKYNSNNVARGKIAQIIKENFKKAGIDVVVKAVEWNAYLDDLDKHNMDAYIMGWTGVPFPNPRQIWHSKSYEGGGSNYIAYNNPKIDELIDKANLEFDSAKRAKQLQEINRILYDEQPYLFVYESDSLILTMNKKMKSKVWAHAYDVEAPVDIYEFVE